MHQQFSVFVGDKQLKMHLCFVLYLVEGVSRGFWVFELVAKTWLLGRPNRPSALVFSNSLIVGNHPILIQAELHNNQLKLKAFQGRNRTGVFSSSIEYPRSGECIYLKIACTGGRFSDFVALLSLCVRHRPPTFYLKDPSSTEPLELFIELCTPSISWIGPRVFQEACVKPQSKKNTAKIITKLDDKAWNSCWTCLKDLESL